MIKLRGTKKGLTLVELMVTLLCAALLFAFVAGSVFMIDRLSKNVLSNSSELHRLQSVRDHVVNNFESGFVQNNPYAVVDGKLTYTYTTQQEGNPVTTTEVLWSETDVVSITFAEIDCSADNQTNLYRCVIAYGEDRNLTFVIRVENNNV